MKQCFISKRFGRVAEDLIARTERIFTSYEAQGYDLTLRQLYYVFIAKDLFPASWIDRAYNLRNGLDPDTKNTEKNYKNFGGLISDARLAGLLDWEMIDDRGRTVTSNPHWENPRVFIDSVAPQFQFDKWADQENYVEVMVEKQALEGVLEPLCRELDIKFSSNKGYSSSSAMFKAGKRLKRAMGDAKKAHMIYLGDHDPSGIDMTRDVEERLNLFSDAVSADGLQRIKDMGEDIPTLIEAGELDGVTVHRVALNMDQVEALKLPKNPAKITDSRAADYISKFGPSSWELDAIEPQALAKLVRDKVHDLRDSDIWGAAIKRETAMRNELLALAKKSKFK